MKIVFFADLHLDAPFAWLGGSQLAARRRRQSLRDTLGTIIRLADVIHADALLCGGDLFEQARYTPDTVAFLERAFEEIEPMRVFLAPGNHDWYGPESPYRQARWSPNVHIFTEDRLRAGPDGGRPDALGRGPPGAGPARSGSWTNSRSTGAGSTWRCSTARSAAASRPASPGSSRTRRSTRPRSRRPASIMRWSGTTTGHGTRSGTPTRATRTS